jgi:hypothetical protein
MSTKLVCYALAAGLATTVASTPVNAGYRHLHCGLQGGAIQFLFQAESPDSDVVLELMVTNDPHPVTGAPKLTIQKEPKGRWIMSDWNDILVLTQHVGDYNFRLLIAPDMKVIMLRNGKSVAAGRCDVSPIVPDQLVR